MSRPLTGINTCGHADRPHYAKGKCRSCYTNGRHKLSPAEQAQEAAELTAAGSEVVRLERRLEELQEAAREIPMVEKMLEAARGALEDERELRQVASNDLHARSFLDDFPAYWSAMHARDQDVRLMHAPLPNRPACLPEPSPDRLTYEATCRAWERLHGQCVIGLTTSGEFQFAPRMGPGAAGGAT
jgi:hypothetical protein